MLWNCLILNIYSQEHVIHVWKDTSTILHDALVHQYREQAISFFADGKLSEEKAVRAKLLTFLEVSTNYSPENALVQFPYDSEFRTSVSMTLNLLCCLTYTIMWFLRHV